MLNKNKILLVGINTKFNHICPALYILANSLKEKGYESNLLELAINRPYDEILAEIFDYKCDVICFASYIWNISLLSKLVPDLKKIMPECKIILGGGEMTSQGSYRLATMKGLDFVIEGEGEVALPLLIEALENNANDFSSVPNLVWRNASENKIIANEKGAYLDLGKTPFLYTGVDLNTFKDKIVYYESSRGCPFSCAFCSSAGENLRERPIELVKEDLKLLINSPIKLLKFVDRTFNAKPKRAVEIIDFLIENYRENLCIHFEIDPRLLTDEVVEALGRGKVGYFQIECGVQSTNPEALKAINKKINWEQVSHNVKNILAKNNIHTHLDLIAGLPCENLESFRKSFADVYKLKPHYIQLGFLKILRGSPLGLNPEKYGLVYMNEPPYAVLYNNELSYSDVRYLEYAEFAVEQFYNDGFFINYFKIIENFYNGAILDFFATLGKYTRENVEGYPSITEKARVLLEFSRENASLDSSIIKEILRFDWRCRHNKVAVPEFLVREDFTKIGSEVIEEKFPELVKMPPQKRKQFVQYDEFDFGNIEEILREKELVENLPNFVSGKYLFLINEKQGVFGTALPKKL